MDNKKPCKYQAGVGCYNPECSDCGWNPEVKEMRVAALRDWANGSNERVRKIRGFYCYCCEKSDAESV